MHVSTNYEIYCWDVIFIYGGFSGMIRNRYPEPWGSADVDGISREPPRLIYLNRVSQVDDTRFR